MANLFGGEGRFGLRASGDGEALVSMLLQSRNPEAFMEWVVHTVAARVQP